MTAFLAVRLMLLTLGILSAVAHWFIPRLTRPDLYFAVTVVPNFRDSAEGAFILRRYHQDLIAVTTAVMAALVVMLATKRALPLAPLVLVLQSGACFFIFYRARRLVLPYAAAPTTVREAQVGNRSRRVPGGWLLASGPFALLAASAYYLATHWSRIPMRIVLHWASDGRPDRWMARSPIDVFAPLLIGLVVVCAMALVLHGMAHWLRPIYAGGAEGRQESRFRSTASVMLLALEYWVSIVASFVAARPLVPGALQHPPALVAMVPLLIAVGTAALLMWLGQGGSRLPIEQAREPDPSRPIGDRTEDRFWKLGVFYCNHDDPSVLVERRFGIGYTVNFAHPIAWVIAVIPALALIVVAVTIVARHAAR
ncbi:hypothetical protein GALL_201540 [mine drainage metagenome]|uniref:DUF1648 domain-containing protein n=1 Tax=mine drainage metagenome TaxID=410659 RepID=A0A1J5SC80_9ZZZZ